MKKLFLIALLFLTPFVSNAQLTVPQGGTGTTTFPQNWFVTGNSALRLTATGTPFFSNFFGGNGTVNNFTITGTCTGCGISYPFTPTTNFAVLTQATTGIPWFQNGVFASSTSHFVNFDFTNSTGTIGVLHTIKGDATDGLIVQSANGTDVAVLGPANTSNATFYGGFNIDGATRIATSITGPLQAIAGAITATSTISQAFIDSAIARDSEIISPNWQFSSVSAITPTTTVGVVVNASSSITGLSIIRSTTTNATTTWLGINNESFNDLTGSGLTISSNALTCATGSSSVFGCLTAANFNTFNNKVGTSSSATAGQLAYFTTTSGTPALISGVATGTVSGSGGVSVTAGRAAIGGALAISCDVASGSIPGCISTASFTSFTNKVTSNWQFSGTSAITPTSTVGIIVNASSSITRLRTINATTTGKQYIPNSTSPSLTETGLISINTTSASSSLHYHDGTTQAKLFNETDSGFTFINTPTFGQGTTTLIKAGGRRGFTYTGGSCIAIGGTANISTGTGSASTTMISAGTSLTGQTFTTFSSNNTFNSLQPVLYAVGTFSSSGTTTVACTYGRTYSN